MKEPKVSATVVQHGNYVLLLRRGPTAPWMPNKWNFPTGHIEDGESPLQAAQRETLEESSLVVSNLRHVLTLNLPTNTVAYFHTTSFEGEPQIDFESSDWAWVPIAGVQGYDTIPGVNRALAAAQSVERIQTAAWDFLKVARMARRTALRAKIASRPKLPILWWENEDGDRWVQTYDEGNDIQEHPPGYIYQWSRFPTQLHEHCLRMVQQDEVDACPHPPESIKADLGIIDSMEGRECSGCHGYQSKNKGEPWPDKWEAHGSREVMVGTSTWSDDLVLAMVRPSPEELAKAVERFGQEPRLLGMDDAILMAATSCERCLNGMLWRYGLDDGYPPYSPEWDKCRTSCLMCRDRTDVWDWLLNKPPKTAKTAHYTELCRECGAVISQCRCRHPNKEIRYGLCEECGGPGEDTMFDDLESYLPTGETLDKDTDKLASKVAARFAKLSPQQRGWERRRENDERALNNIPPEHAFAWKKLKKLFKGTPDQRAEQFMEYLEEHPGESDEWLQENADKEVSKAIREWEKEQREEAKAEKARLREQKKLEKDCDRKQIKYENAWYKEQERATKVKHKLQELKGLADDTCLVCPTCPQPQDDTVDPFEERVPFAASLRVAARFKNKKQVKKQDGSGEMTVYEYSDQQISRRNTEKAKRIEALSKSIAGLRKQVFKDLTSKDPVTALTALAVGLMDETYERVGNDGSAKEGHFGVTGWQKKHITFGKGKATVRYVGKSGVKQEKIVSDSALVKALRKAVDNAGEGSVFSPKDGKVGAGDVNTYLDEFNITAKDIRGFHANDVMRGQLESVRKGKLPSDPKEHEKVLKAEFKAALEATAAVVGHEPSTLRSMYLVPNLEDSYIKDGTVLSKLDKKAMSSRLAGRWGDR
jgi:DNA topoisomerase I